MKQIFWILFVLIWSLTGCIRTPETIKDISELPQDHVFYRNDLKNPRDIMAPAAQNLLNEDYNIIYFSVWHQKEPFHALPERVTADFKKFGRKTGYGENKKKHTSAWLKKLRQNAALAGYPNALYPAITTRACDMRILPTQQPHFSSTEGDSCGWPFDNLQRSSVAANAPLFVCHISADKAWALVETDFAFGWIPVQDFAAVDEAFIKKWETGRYAVITRDKITVNGAREEFLLKASLGYIFPLVRNTAEKRELLVAVADENNKAVIKSGFINRTEAAAKPLRFNSLNAVKIANELIGEPYGWGGLYGNRDCSALTRDFFAVFGLWLPRHSQDQVKEVGSYINLAGLNPEEKEKTILTRGIPYLTIIWRRGHIMLYIGEQEGRALVFHNIWGIRIRDLQGKQGRKIIGQAVITTLQPGQELIALDAGGGDLRANISGMSILAADN